MKNTLTRIIQTGIAGAIIFLGTSCASIKDTDDNLIKSEMMGIIKCSSYKDGRTVVEIDTDNNGKYDTTLTHKKAGEADYRRLEWNSGNERFCYEISTQGMGWDILTREEDGKKEVVFENRSDQQLYHQVSKTLNDWTEKTSLYELGRQTERFLRTNSTNTQ